MVQQAELSLEYTEPVVELASEPEENYGEATLAAFCEHNGASASYQKVRAEHRKAPSIYRN